MIHDHIPMLLPDHFNRVIIDLARSYPSWGLEGRYPTEDPNEVRDTGASIKVYVGEEAKTPGGHEIMFIGQLILSTYLRATTNKYSNVQLARSYINYYNQSSHCPRHTDGAGINGNLKEASLLYFLNTSADSYTEIEGQRFYSNSGDVVVFDCNDEHFATGAVTDKTRYTFNIMFRYTERMEK